METLGEMSVDLVPTVLNWDEDAFTFPIIDSLHLNEKLQNGRFRELNTLDQRQTKLNSEPTCDWLDEISNGLLDLSTLTVFLL